MKRNAPLTALCCSLCALALASPPKIAQAQAVLTQDALPGTSEGISTGYAAGSVLVSGFNVLSIVNNRATSSSPKWGYIGVLGGVLGMGLGGASLMDNPSSGAKTLGIANLAIGALATVCGMSGIAHAKREQSQEQALTGRMPVHFAAGVVGGHGHQHGLGVQLTF